MRLEVYKAERRLVAHCASGARVEFGVALGLSPVGHKQQRGDARTPEGAYRVSGAPRASRFHTFIPLSYPSRADARHALESGEIAQETYERIARADEAGTSPPRDTPLGGDIGIHGEGSRWAGRSAEEDWTLGCISVTDEEIEFLGSRVEVGTPVQILP